MFDVINEEVEATAYGILTCILNAGLVVFPLIAGYIHDLT